MASSPQAQEPPPPFAGPLLAFWRLLASLKLAVILVIILAVVLAGATILESRKGTERVLWYVYHAKWFVALWGLLGINILAAMLIRFPWKMRHIGFFVTHVGILVLLAGALITWRHAVHGQIHFEEGETAESIVVFDHNRIAALRHGRGAERPTDFVFRGGPEDWRPGRTLDLGVKEGVGVKVLKFYRHASKRANWAADASGRGGPALKLGLATPEGRSIIQSWLSTAGQGTTVSIGPARFRLLRLPVDSMLEDLRRPPTEQRANRGVLSMHYGGQTYRVPVDDKVGEKVALGETGIQVEIVRYLPNARRGPDGRLVSEGDQPSDPVLELLVHLPGEQQPVEELAVARAPFVTLDEVRGRRCPVKFWYHHPAVSAEPGAEFWHTSDGTLYCRVGVRGAHEWRGEVSESDQIEMAAHFKLAILKYIPHARQEITFEPVDPAAGKDPMPEAAALVEIGQPGGKPHQLWLQRGAESRSIPTDDGPLLVAFRYGSHPLGFRLKLLDFKRGMNPGRKGDASFASSVQLIDTAKRIDKQREISMNKPLEHGKFTFYQSSFREPPGEKSISILSATYDPGRILKYSGSLLICVGAFVILYVRGPFRGKTSASANRTADKGRPQSRDRRRQSSSSRSGSATDQPTGTGRARSG